MTAIASDKSPEIHGLASANRADRASSAASLYWRGAQLAWLAAETWLRDSEFSALVFNESYGNPPVPRPETTVGLAVTPDRFEAIRAANGTPAEANVPPDQDAREFELYFSPNVRLDILTTRNATGEGAIARFLRRHGEGLQQVEFRMRDVSRACALIQGSFGLAPVYHSARPGANGTLVNFFLLTAPGNAKVLIELFQRP